MKDLATLFKSLDAPEWITGLTYELAMDHQGEASVFVTVMLRDKSDDSLYDWSELAPFHDRLWERFTEEQPELRLYIKFELQSEINSPGETLLRVGS